MAEPSGAKGAAARDAYRAAGVDVEAGEQAVALIRDAVASARRPEVVGGLGGFAGAIEIPAGYRRPLLVASTDGVGTKVALARRAGRLDGLGIDLVAMCADDVACAGAEPLFLLDYVAVGRLVPTEVATIVGGVAAGAGSPAAPCSAARRPSTRGSCAPTTWTWQRRASASSSARTCSTGGRSKPATCSWASRRRASTATASRSCAGSWRTQGWTWMRRTRPCCGATRRARPSKERWPMRRSPTSCWRRPGSTRGPCSPFEPRFAQPGTGSTSTESRTSPAAACPATCPGSCRTGWRLGWSRGAGRCRR